jgi:ferredoxin
VEQCPAAALAVVDQSIERDRDACVACGRCVTACPAGAVHNPGITPAQLHAQIRALLDPGVGPQDHRGIVFTCRRATPVATNGWYPVTVPCAGMVPPAWLLAPLVMGAGAVAAADCPDDGCLLASAPDRGQAVAWCRAALQELGLSPPRVSAVADGEPPEPLGRVPLQDPFSSSGIAEVLLALTALAPSVEPAPIEAEGSPLGVVELAEEACTLCGTCAQTCPTGALALRERANRATVSFDHGQCTACGLCVDRCPEVERGAISMSRRTNLHMLQDPRATLAEDRIITCESCGSSITTAKVMRRLDQLIGDHPGVLDHASRYCIECRGSKSGPPGPASAVFAGPRP